MAFDARTGKVVWKFQTGGVIIAPPVSYALNGKQYIAVGAGAFFGTAYLLGVAEVHDVVTMARRKLKV